MASERQTLTTSRIVSRHATRVEFRTPYDVAEQWKSRLNNERTGLPRKDMSGLNAGVSMLWCPESNIHLTEPRGRPSRKRHTELFARVNDFGSSDRPATSHMLLGSQSASGATLREWPQRAEPSGREAAHMASEMRSTELESRARLAGDAELTASVREEINGVRSRELARVRLSRAAELRKNGELFLHAGNLQQAKEHFKRAETLLQMDARRYELHRSALQASAEYRMTGMPRGDSFY